MKTKIIPCICSEPVDEYGSIYDGMPQLRVTDYNENLNTQYYEAFCPKCGRGGLIQFKSAYLALKDWNKMQKGLREFEEWKNDRIKAVPFLWRENKKSNSTNDEYSYVCMP